MRNKILMTAAAAFILSSVSLAPQAVLAQPSPSEMRKAGEIKDPASADAAVAKDEATAAKSKARKAHSAAKKADDAVKDAAKSN